MAKVCVACGQPISVWASRGKVADGYIHLGCWRNAQVGLNIQDYGRLYTGAAIKERIAARNGSQELTADRQRIRHIGLHSFDDNTQTFVIVKSKKEHAVYHYNQIVDFELLENGQTITKGGLGRAVVGGVLFGGVGAVVGGVTANRKAKGVCKSLKIKITLRNSLNLTEYIHFIDTATSTDSAFYQNRYETAHEILSALQLAVEQIGGSAATGTPTESVVSSADEILKFKQLLDLGAITQEEFDAKKKQLLEL